MKKADLKDRLIKPDKDSITQFQPFYQITPSELEELCKEYHEEQMKCKTITLSGNFKIKGKDLLL